jgi:hypothetical protein
MQGRIWERLAPSLSTDKYERNELHHRKLEVFIAELMTKLLQFRGQKNDSEDAQQLIDLRSSSSFSTGIILNVRNELNCQEIDDGKVGPTTEKPLRNVVVCSFAED